MDLCYKKLHHQANEHNSFSIKVVWMKIKNKTKSHVEWPVSHINNWYIVFLKFCLIIPRNDTSYLIHDKEANSFHPLSTKLLFATTKQERTLYYTSIAALCKEKFIIYPSDGK